MLGKDLEKCFNYCMIVAWNIVDLIKYSYVDPFLATVTGGLIIHKAPVVHRVCNYTIIDISQFDNATASYYGDMFSIDVWYQLIESISFNGGDIIFLLNEASAAMNKGNYAKVGKMIGHIVSDLFYINPWDGKYVWKELNSEIIESVGSKSSSKKVPSSFYKRLTIDVQAKRDSLGETVGRVFSTVMAADSKSRDDALDYVTDYGASDYEKHIMSKQLKYSEDEAKKPWYDRIVNLKE